jgi:glycine/D-amino acid oxidase-like deaminating enzyme
MNPGSVSSICLSANSAVTLLFVNQRVKCAVNALTGHEHEAGIEPAATPRHVVVVGGGPAGMEAARVAALRGHRVTLLERSDRLGGTLFFAALAYPENGALLDHLVAQIKGLPIDGQQRPARLDASGREGRGQLGREDPLSALGYVEVQGQAGETGSLGRGAEGEDQGEGRHRRSRDARPYPLRRRSAPSSRARLPVPVLGSAASRRRRRGVKRRGM